MPKYQPQRGTYDAYYDEAINIEKIVQILKGTASLYGYTPIITPIYEATELFTRSVGESSDIVSKEMFTFMDKGERSITLRPELTAGVMRAITSNKLYANADLPLKFYYYGPIFRYERPQKGRFRQFSQFGVECVGINSPYFDAETISLAYSQLLMLGFPHVILKINSLGDQESRDAYKEALKLYFADKIQNMCGDCARRYEQNPLRILDCKVPEDRLLIEGAPKIQDYLTESAKDYFETVLRILEESGIEYQVDDSLVRGLDYYSHVVFEFHYLLEDGTSLGAIGAGGHYDHLLHEVGGPDLSSVGYAFGVERLNILLKDIEKEHYEKPNLDVYVMSLDSSCDDEAFNLTEYLRANGFKCEVNFESKSIGSLFKVANRKNAKFALLIGNDELEKGLYKVKNLATQVQVELRLEDIVEYLDHQLEEVEGEHHHE